MGEAIKKLLFYMSTLCLPGSILEVEEELKKCRKRPRIHKDRWTKWAVREACFIN